MSSLSSSAKFIKSNLNVNARSFEFNHTPPLSTNNNSPSNYSSLDLSSLYLANIPSNALRHIRSLAQTQLINSDNAHLIHTSQYNSIVDLYLDESNGLHNSFEFTIQHGLLPQLAIRYLRDLEDEAAVNETIQWLLQSLDKSYPLLGLDAECGLTSVRVRLIQISTRSRCILVRIPLELDNFSIPLPLVNMLEDINIYKSGAEIYGDALDIYRELGICLNSCLNMSLVNQRGLYSLSLESMCNNVIGRDGFIKDKDTAVSNWDAEQLSFRQLLYAALDGQSSYIIGTSNNKPYPFQLCSISAQWLNCAAEWLLMQKYLQKQSDQTKAEMAVELVEYPSSTQLHVKLSNYCNKLRWEKFIYILYNDNTYELGKIDRVDGKLLWISVSPNSSSRRPEDFVRLIVQSDRFEEAIQLPIRQYLSRVIQAQEKFNPFIAAIINTPHNRQSTTNNNPTNSSGFIDSKSAESHPKNSPSGNSGSHNDSSTSSPNLPSYNAAFDDNNISLTTSAHTWWDNGELLPGKVDVAQLPSLYNNLSEQQKQAVALSDMSRIVAVEAYAGTGKTFSLAMEAIRTLHRQQSTVSNHAHAIQSILCITETQTAARELCNILSQYLASDEVVEITTEECYSEWLELAEYNNLIELGYIIHENQVNSIDNSNRRVLITTINTALNLLYSSNQLNFFSHRQTLLIDEAAQMWLLKAVLLLRCMSELERIVMFGDLNQLSASICRENYTVPSLLSVCLAVNTFDDYNFSRPSCWQVQSHLLDIQYRMCKHISDCVSAVFYSGKLISFDQSAVKGLYWRDLKQSIILKADHSKSLYNTKETEEIMKLLLQLERDGFNKEEITILSLDEAQKATLLSAIPQHNNIYSVQQFIGQEAEIIILSLSSDFLTPQLTNSQLITTATTRAKQRLYIIGNRLLLQRYEGYWRLISDYESATADSTHEKRKQSIPDMQADFPALGLISKEPIFSTSNTNSPAIKSKGSTPPSPAALNANHNLWNKLFPNNNPASSPIPGNLTNRSLFSPANSSHHHTGNSLFNSHPIHRPLCLYYQRGFCAAGLNCNYSHENYIPDLVYSPNNGYVNVHPSAAAPSIDNPNDFPSLANIRSSSANRPHSKSYISNSYINKPTTVNNNKLPPYK
jgi:hypothetical protein